MEIPGVMPAPVQISTTENRENAKGGSRRKISGEQGWGTLVSGVKERVILIAKTWWGVYDIWLDPVVKHVLPLSFEGETPTTAGASACGGLFLLFNLFPAAQ